MRTNESVKKNIILLSTANAFGIKPPKLFLIKEVYTNANKVNEDKQQVYKTFANVS